MSMRQLSNKDQKMGGKNSRPHHTNTNICWICHQEPNLNGKKDGSEDSSQFFQARSLSFRPCLCRGSIGIVHQECLNKWASEKYKSLIKNSPNDDLPVICCPNCKAPYEYTVFEMTKFKGFKSMKLVSMESLWLLFLLVAQISVLIYDIFYLSKKEEKNKTEETAEEAANETSINYMELSKYLHIFTALIVICAGAVNLLQYSHKETKVEIHSQY